MASIGWQVGAGGVPIPISTISRGSATTIRPRRAKVRPGLASILPLRDVSKSPTNRNVAPPLLDVKSFIASDTADCVVLVSADGANFRVSRSVLAYASPVFQRLFSNLKSRPLNSPASSSSSSLSELDTPRLSHETLADGTPLIRMSESGKTLDALLRYLYPSPPSPGELFDETSTHISIDDIKPVLLAAHKYSIRPVLDEICARLLSDLSLPPTGEDNTYALRVYGLSCLIKRRSLAEAAAYASLRVRIIGAYFPELEHLPAIHYFRLLAYHRKCASAACELLTRKVQAELGNADTNDGSTDGNFFTCLECCVKSENTPEMVHTNKSRKRKLAEVINVACQSPRSQLVFSEEFISEVASISCDCVGCRRSFTTRLMTASVALKDEIERCTHRVDIELSTLDPVESNQPDKGRRGRTFNFFDKLTFSKRLWPK